MAHYCIERLTNVDGKTVNYLTWYGRYAKITDCGRLKVFLVYNGLGGWGSIDKDPRATAAEQSRDYAVVACVECKHRFACLMNDTVHRTFESI